MHQPNNIFIIKYQIEPDMGSRIAVVKLKASAVAIHHIMSTYIHQCEMQRASKPLDTSNDYEKSAICIGLRFYSLHGVPFSTAAQLFFLVRFDVCAGEIILPLWLITLPFNSFPLLNRFSALSYSSIMGLLFCYYICTIKSMVFLLTQCVPVKQCNWI